MLDCQENSDNISCKHCQESKDNQTYWGIQLDQDLLETIVSIYPEWFKDCNICLPNMADGNAHHTTTEDGKIIIPLYHTREMESPPKAIVDDASLQKTMNKNKESLKVKLMLRRPLNQLVEQGIMPPLKTSPHFHEQRQKLERAKMGDILKNKIQRRPDRQELIQQHILEDTTIDPSLQDKQRQLKKARLADDLNDRLSHRPGPLELIKGNILQTDEKFAQAIKEGHIPFKRTCEGQTQKHPPPRFLLDEDSGSEGASSPPDITDQTQNNIPSLEISRSSTPRQGSPDSLIDVKPCIAINENSNSSSGCISHINNQHIGIITTSGSNRSESSLSSNKSRKKSKSKSQPKTRTIKFHEYKGPPNAQKNQISPLSATAETSYELLLQQQQLFLQWQLEWQQKYPQIILPAAQKSIGDQGNSGGSICINTQLNDQTVNQESTTSPPRNISKLEDMKVSDLKAELKKRNLPVSGSKPQLIERLKPYSETTNPVISSLTSVTTNSLPLTVGSIILDTTATTQNEIEMFPSVVTTSNIAPNKVSTVVCEDVTVGVYRVPSAVTQLVASRPSSVAPMEVDNSPNMAMEVVMDVNENSATPITNEEIVKMQQRKIEELQRELQRSQMQLHQQQQSILQQKSQPQTQQIILSGPVHLQSQPVVDNINKTISQGSPIDAKVLQRQILQQHFQNKIQQHQQGEQQTSQLQQHSNGINNILSPSQPSSAAVKASLAAFLHNQHAVASLTNVSIAASPVISHIASSQPVVSIPARVLTNKSISSVTEQSKHYTSQAIIGPSSVISTTISSSSKHIDSYPNGINNQRTSTLPTFSALLGSKQTENINESQFITKPPPDYNEATKQLVKSQPLEQNLASHFPNQSSNKSCDERDIKSQAVDDVLEILIKNGELSPSVVQEPTVNNMKVSKSSSVCPTYCPVTSSFSLSVPHSSGHSHFNSRNTSSVIGHPPITSPPSTVLRSTNAPLDFDFHLDLDDIEAMDLGGVLSGDETAIPKFESKSPLSINNTRNTLEENGNSIILSGNNSNMDVELPDWLDTMMPPTSSVNTVSNTSISGNATPCNNIRNSYRNDDPDPLLSTLANSNDPYDLFSIEGIDFKLPSTDFNLHNWDKVDFAT